MFKAIPFWTVLIVAINMAFVITACSGAAVPTTVPNTTPDDATVPVDWITYTSHHYGYSIDYPTAWVATPAKRDWTSSGSSYPDDDAVDKWTAPSSDPWTLMFVLSVQLAEGESAANRIAKLDQENAGLCELGHRHNVTIDGMAARQEDGKCFGRDYISQIAVVRSGRFYFIYLLSGSPFSETTLATFDRFVASFRFVDGSKKEANLPFPTGKFINSKHPDHGLIFNEDGTSSAFESSSGGSETTIAKGTYTVKGDIFTDTSKESFCPPMSFKYTFDGTYLTFNYVGDPSADPCADGRRPAFDNVTYTR